MPHGSSVTISYNSFHRPTLVHVYSNVLNEPTKQLILAT